MTMVPEEMGLPTEPESLPLEWMRPRPGKEPNRLGKRSCQPVWWHFLDRIGTETIKVEEKARQAFA
jgi:hypothetical protein